MSSETIGLEVSKRDIVRKGLRAIRDEGNVPAVLHNHGKDSIHIMMDNASFRKTYSDAGHHHPVELTLEGKKHLAMIKEIDFEPTRNRVRHAVFQAIRANETTNAEIPLTLSGDMPAERKNLLVLQQIDVVEVEALPRDLPDELVVDATVLVEVGDRIHISDIKAPKGVTILADPEAVIAAVEMPKDQLAEADASAASLAEDAADAGEPVEVIEKSDETAGVNDEESKPESE